MTAFRPTGSAFVLIALCIAIVGSALAHTGATGIVKKRMESMNSIAEAMMAISKLDWLSPDTARSELAEHARQISDHASHIVKMFPAGSIEGPSEAIPAIWERPDDFRRLADALGSRAAELAAIASKVSSAGEIKPQMVGLGDTCKSCHQGYRREK